MMMWFDEIFLVKPNRRKDYSCFFQLPSKDRKELRLEVLKEAAKLGVNLYEEHQRFVMSIDPQWRADENVMLLLSAIALFTPERSNVVHKDVIKFEQVRYKLCCYLL